MGTYIHFTEEQKRRANEVDLEEFLRCRGEKLIPSGREKRLASDKSITIRGGEFFDHADRKGGRAIDFVQKHYGLSFPEAVQLLLGGEGGKAYPAAREKVAEPPKPFVLPPAHSDMRRVYAYLLKQRGIEREIINHFARAGTLYEDAEYHNAVFVGKDEHGDFRHAHKRSSNTLGKVFRINVEGSDPRYSFHHMGTDGRLLVFEAPIDMLSYISMHPQNWQAHSYVSCCGTSAIPVMKMLERMGQRQSVFLCLDNDKAGHEASLRMAEEIAERFDIASDRLCPTHKDWNDDLLAMRDAPQPAMQMELR